MKNIFSADNFSETMRCIVIAEVSQTHEGSLGQAFAFVDAAAEAGADAIKFQTHIAEYESTPNEPFRIKFSKQDENRFAYWKRMEFTEAQWFELANYAREKGLHFLSSPFSLEAVRLLEAINVPAWKIGSGEIRNWPMLEQIIETKKPILISTGMSTWEEIDSVVEFLKQRDAIFSIFQATTMYPTPAENVGLNNITALKEKYNCPVGLSDHSGTIYPALAAVTMGAKLIETHITLSKRMFGPDVSSSLEINEFKKMIDGIRFIEASLKNPIDKNHMATELSELRQMFTKSVVPSKNLQSGKILEKGDLTLKKPATGISADLLNELYGKKIKRDLTRDEFFSLKDIEDAK